MIEKKIEKPSWMERLAFNYFIKKAAERKIPVDEFHIMNPQEVKSIKRVSRITLSLSAFYGVLGVLFLYIPIYAFPNFFFAYNYYFLPLDITLEIPVITTIYSAILVFVELYALTITQLWAVRAIANACGYLNLSDPDYHENVKALILVGMEKKNKKLLTLGINPLEGMSKFNLFLYMLFTKLKATMTNFVVKLLL